MITIEDKIDKAELFIEDILSTYKNPAILCSFGKDSLTLLHITKGMGLNLPVIFFRMPFFPKKYAFAEKVIQDWDLTVYDWAPARVSFDCANGVGHAIQHHQMGGTRSLALAMGVVPFKEGERHLCTVDDMLKRPFGNFNFPWDVCLHGHKNSDLDPVSGKIGLKVDILQIPGSNDYAYPLRFWSDDDVWEYIEKYNVPVNSDRYEKVDGNWTDKKDKGLNPDYFPACWKCIDKSESETVFCPKKKCEINNVSSAIEYDKLQMEYMDRS